MLARSMPITGLMMLLLVRLAAADVIQLAPSKDNTLIQQTDPAQQRANGLGDIFVGRTGQDGTGAATISIRRGLVAFDVAGNIPSGSTITSVSLTMRDVMGLNGDPTVELRRLLQDWGEGTSFQNGGQGALATEGDATWLYRFFDFDDPTASPTWSNPGGDFSSTVSASVVISDDLGGGQLFTWSSANDPQLLVDVQSWLDNPGDNFGWTLLGDESTGFTAKRLNSSESLAPPVLEITYVVPEPASLMLLATGAALLLVGRNARRRMAQSGK